MRKYGAYLPALLMDACISSILTNAAFYINYLHFSSTFLGTLTAISTGVFVLLAIPFGRLSDKIGRPHVLTLACFSLAAVSILLPFCTRKLYLMIAFPCSGIGMALFWPTYEAWLAEREGDGDLIRRITTFNLFWTVGITIGPMISSYLYKGTSPVLAFYLAGGFSLVNWITLESQTIVNRKNLRSPEHSDLNEAPPHAAHRTYLRIARIANFASWFSAWYRSAHCAEADRRIRHFCNGIWEFNAGDGNNTIDRLSMVRYESSGTVALSTASVDRRSVTRSNRLLGNRTYAAWILLDVCLCGNWDIRSCYLLQQHVLQLARTAG